MSFPDADVTFTREGGIGDYKTATIRQICVLNPMSKQLKNLSNQNLWIAFDCRLIIQMTDAEDRYVQKVRPYEIINLGRKQRFSCRGDADGKFTIGDGFGM